MCPRGSRSKILLSKTPFANLEMVPTRKIKGNNLIKKAQCKIYLIVSAATVLCDTTRRDYHLALSRVSRGPITSNATQINLYF